MRKGTILFLSAVIFQCAAYAILFIQHRIPGGWDTFQYFHLQYYFLNHKVIYGDIPYWIPYLTHGTVATWWYSCQAGLSQLFITQPFAFFTHWLAQVNFLDIFNLGVFFDEIVLLVGVWLLARRFLKSPYSIFIVAVSVLGSSIWMTQFWFNLHIYYCIPLICHFGHRFFETGRWRYVFLAGNLLILQVLGNLPYFIPLITLTIFLYFLFYIAFNFKETVTERKWRLSLNALVALLAVGFSCYLAFFSVSADAQEIVTYNYQRSATQRLSLETFMTYGRNLGLLKWVEMVLGVSPSMEITLFLGFLAVPLVITGLVFNVRRGNAHLLCLIIALFLFESGTVFSKICYYVWPYMKFYRHLGLSAAITKIFVCLWAGVGFDIWMRALKDEEVYQKIRRFLLVMALFLFGIAVFLISLSSDLTLAESIAQSLVEGTTYKIDEVRRLRVLVPGLLAHIGPITLGLRLVVAGLWAGAISVILLIFVFKNSQQTRRIFLYGLILFHVGNMFQYRFFETKRRTVALDKKTVSVLNFRKMPYASRRLPKFKATTPRDQILSNLRFRPLYWSVYAFLFKDEAGHYLRTDHWLKPLDHFMKAYWHQPIGDYTTPPKGMEQYMWLNFPLWHEAARKIAGVEEDKVQFFASAHAVSDDENLARWLVDNRHKGDVLFIHDESDKTISQGTIIENLVARDERVRLDYTIEHFDADNLKLSVDTKGQRGVWLMYSDVWHPNWTATINGAKQDVRRAHLAYKAVELDEGLNKVHFQYRSPKLRLVLGVLGLNALGWIGIVCYYLIKREDSYEV